MQTIKLDLSKRTIIPQLYAKQIDVGRKLKVILEDNGAPYSVPAGAAVSVWYSGASGEGNYTDVGEEKAVQISGNEITVELIAQMLTNSGPGVLCIVINTAGGEQLATWNIPYMVEPLPGMGSAAAQAYFSAFSKAVEILTNLTPSATSVSYEPQDLSEPQKAQTRANIDAAPASHVDDKENPHGATAQQVGAAPAVEDEDHPGCYYRMIEGEKEWINPPMLEGVEYRTTERRDGKPVFVTLTANGISKRTADGVINTKRSGTYVGTGTSRTVDVGAVGTALLIVAEGGFAIIRYNEAGTYVGKDGTITSLTGANCWWQPIENGGDLGIVGDNAINRNGTTYLWSVI